MDYTLLTHTDEKQIVISGQLTFADSQKFKQILDALPEVPPRSLTLDFRGTDFIDSAGLGMLLLLRDECQTRNIPLSITSASGQVLKIFLISKFDQLFTLRS
jgi:stage II sporulation protein AA (anti-sigma F factor antagonist)